MLYGANALIAVAVKSPRFGTVKPSLAHCGPSAWGATRIGYGVLINVDGLAVPTLDQQEGSNGAPTVLVDQALRLADDGQSVFPCRSNKSPACAHPSQYNSFISKTDAHKWARQIEGEMDKAVFPIDKRILVELSAADLIARYRDTVAINKRSYASELKRLEVFLQYDWANKPISQITTQTFASFRDKCLKQVRPATVVRDLGILRSMYETSRNEWDIPILGPVLAIRYSDIVSTGAACTPPVPVNEQVQATRVAPDLGVMLRRPAGAIEVYWGIEFDAKTLQGLAKAGGQTQFVCHRTGQF